MTVRLLPAAQAELDEAILWYSTQAPGLGQSFLLEFLLSVQLIEQHPQAWHPLSAHTRRCRLRRFPYGVIYAVDATDILILAVAHQHRKPFYWQDRAN